MSKRSRIDYFIIGFALFSMFFGAGNVIFPPYLGMTSGHEWITGFSCYYIADIGMALVALFSIFSHGSSEEMIKPIGKTASTVLMCIIVLCIGPMLAIPRTAAMTYEMGVQPLTSGIDSVAFSIIFFCVVLICSIKETSVIDIVGKVLTPLLLLGLLVLIVKGIVNPLGSPSMTTYTESVTTSGIKAGYQTMDVLATVLFGALVMQSVIAKGYTTEQEQRKVAGRASVVAGILLLAVYGGLTYLGATVSGIYDPSIGRASLMLNIVYGLLGKTGTVIFSVVVALACLTTAVGLVSSCAEYFSKLSNNNLPYSALVIGICVFSAIVSNIGLEQLVSIAGPVLEIVYPPTLVLIALSYFKNLPDLVHKSAVVGALAFSLINAVSFYGKINMPFLHYLPLSELDLGWLVPSVVCGAIGFLVHKYCLKTEVQNNEETLI